MPYRYTVKRNLEDFSSGRVFYTLPGQPAFPVRLASEIFQRALEHWRTAGGQGRCHIFDPVCGGGYWLSALAYLHWQEIAAISASDINAEVLLIAERNLALLTTMGLERRIAEIEVLRSEFGKPSHVAALQSAQQFQQQLVTNLNSHPIAVHLFLADATDPGSIKNGLGNKQVDLVLADVPYGWHSTWVAQEKMENPPAAAMLEALYPNLKPGSVVAVATDKSQNVESKKYHRLERFQIGKRRMFILQPR